MVVGAVAIYCLKEVGSRDSHPSKTAKGGAASVFSSPSRSAVVGFVLIAVTAPVLWLAYNGIVYRNPLEFANGHYSAKAIERKKENAGSRGYPASGNPALAGMYFLKSAEVNLAENQWLQRPWILLAVAGVVGAALRSPQPTMGGVSSIGGWLPLMFFLVPLPFYAL